MDASSRARFRRQIDRTLERDLSFLSGALRRGRDVPRSGMSERVGEVIRAYEGSGLLTAGEADAWRERFARAARAVRTPNRKVVPPEIRARAEQLLEEHLAQLKAADPDAPSGRPSPYPMLSTLTDLGVITPAESNVFLRRVKAVSRNSRPQPPRKPPAPPPRLLRVVAGPAERLGGVRVTAAELFEASVRLWWHRTASPEELVERDRERAVDEPRWPRPAARHAARRFKLSDDLGTRYEAQVPGCDEDTPWTWMMPFHTGWREPKPSALFGRATFRPGVPREATRLEALSGADRFVLDLAG